MLSGGHSDHVGTGFGANFPLRRLSKWRGYSITSSAATSTTSLSSRLLGELAHGGTAGNSGIEQNVSTCGNIEKVIRYRPSMSLVARQCWSSRAGEAAQHESG
jgi:hypothetical protein